MLYASMAQKCAAGDCELQINGCLLHALLLIAINALPIPAADV